MVSPVDLAEDFTPDVRLKKAELGPAMLAITGKQQKFVLYFVGYGLQKGFATRSAERAGYKGDANTLKSMAYSLQRHPKVVLALQEEVAKLDGILGAQARLRMVGMMDSGDEEIRFKATNKVLEMTGQMIQRSEIVHKHEIAALPTEELNRRIEELERKVLAQREAERLKLPAPVDGEFTVVESGTESALAVCEDSKGANDGQSE